MKEKVRKFVESPFGKIADKFCNSIWCILTYCAVCIISHTYDLAIVGALCLTVLLTAAFLFSKNSFTIVPFFLMSPFVLSLETKPDSGYFNTPGRIAILCILLIVLVFALAFNIVYYEKWRKIYKKAYLTVSIALLTAVLIIGGIGTTWYSANCIFTAIAIGASLYIPYSLLINCGEYDGKKTIKYFAYTITAAAMVIFAAIIQKYIELEWNWEFISANKGIFEFGYTISNGAGAILLMAIPATLYLVYSYKYGYLFMAAMLIEMAGIVMVFSRSAFLVATTIVAVISIFLCFKKKTGRVGYWIALIVVIALAVVFVFTFREVFYVKLSAVLSISSTGSGRTILWKEGFAAWKQAPIFGVGLWYLPITNAPSEFYSYHCSPLTYFYCAGIVGLAAYLFHRYKTVRLFFCAKPTIERLFIAFSIVAVISNSLMDVYMTEPLHLLYYVIMLALMECDVKSKSATANNCVTDVIQSDNNFIKS